MCVDNDKFYVNKIGIKTRREVIIEMTNNNQSEKTFFFLQNNRHDTAMPHLLHFIFVKIILFLSTSWMIRVDLFYAVG